MNRIRERISPGTVLATIALFLALTGGAYAVGKNSVGSKQLKKNAVTTAKIKKNAVTTAKIRKNAVTSAKIKDGAVTGPKVRVDTLGPVPKVQGHETRPVTRVVAATGADYDTARDAAPEVEMFTVGPVTLYAKCFTDESAVETNGVFYIKTAENGVIFGSDRDDAAGHPDFLDTDTIEDDRELMDEYAGENSAYAFLIHSDETVAMLPDGRAFEARMSLAVKNGTLAGGNGMYGEGDVCLFTGDLTEYR